LTPEMFVADPRPEVKNPVGQPADVPLLLPTYKPGSVLPYPVLRDTRTGKTVDLAGFVEGQKPGVIVGVDVRPGDGLVVPQNPNGNGHGKDGGKGDPGKNADPAQKVRYEQLPDKVKKLPIAQNVNNGKVQLGQRATDDNSNTQFAMMALWVARK